MLNRNRELINDILTGLLVAATFAVGMPAEALADLAATTQNTESTVVKPALQAISLVSYGLGATMVVAGIAGAKKHADNPGSNPLGPALGKLGAGAAFLTAPTVIGMLQKTGQNTATDTASFTGINF